MPTLVGNFFTNNGNTDVAMITSPGYMLSNMAILQDAGDLGAQNKGRGATVTRVVRNNAINSLMCKSGAATGRSCGTYQGTVTANYPGGIVLHDMGMVAGAAVNCGDSGAPVTTAELEPSAEVWTVAGTGVQSGGNHEQVVNGCGGANGTYFVFTRLVNIEALGLNIVTTSTAVPVMDAPPGSKCIDVPAASLTNGQDLVQYGCNGAAHQLFLVRPRYGQYSLVPLHSAGVTQPEKCMDVEGASSANLAPIQQWGCVYPAPANQRFRFAWTSGYGQDFQLQAVNSAKCVDVRNGSTSDGAPLQQYTCSVGGSSWNQRWHHY